MAWQSKAREPFKKEKAMTKKKDFREGITVLGDKATDIMSEYFNGKRSGTDMVREASKMIGHAIKVEHINQIKFQSDRSSALRLMQFLPKSAVVRNRYIEMMNPELKPVLLLDRPKDKE